MANLILIKNRNETINLNEIEVHPEEKIRDLLFETEKILPDIFILKKEHPTYKGKKMDLVGLDKDNNIVIVELGGYIDQTNSRYVEKVISDILKSEKLKIIFDLSSLVYISSAGWGIFVGEIKTVRDLGGDIKIACMSPEVYEVFQMLEFYHIIQDFSTTDEAAKSFLNLLTESNDQEEIAVMDSSENESIEDLLAQTGVKSDGSVQSKEDEIVMEDTSGKEDIKDKENTPKGKNKAQKKKIKPIKKLKSSDINTTIDISKLPINEKIKKVVENYPLLTILKIRKMLRHDKFGNTKIGIVKFYRILKSLNLESKKKRYRFYRST